MLTGLQYQILKRIAPPNSAEKPESRHEGGSKYAHLLGETLFAETAGKVVIDFGCGLGIDAIEMARLGATRVIGIDIRADVLERARIKALQAGVDNCVFATTTTDLADIIVSVDAFEHFDDPALILNIMETLLKPDGEVIISFGPTWFHPFGGHLFSVFPWAHLVFSQSALIRWRSTFKNDGATRFSEVAGGLNQMTIARFQKFVESSAFRLTSMELVPIRRLRYVHNPLTREFTTAIVRCRLSRAK